MNIKDICEAALFRINGGSDYGWPCFGPHARFIDFCSTDGAEDTVSCVIDSVDQTVYEITVYPADSSVWYRWHPKAHAKAYQREVNKRLKAGTLSLCDETTWVTIEDEAAILELVRQAIRGELTDASSE